MTPLSTCHLCCEEFDQPGAVLHHLRIAHPSLYADIERWPDGSIVWHDADPTPDEIIGDVA